MSHPKQETPAPSPAPEGTNGDDRRSFLGKLSSAAMAGGLLAGYGSFGAMAAKFLYPNEKAMPHRWVFVADLASFTTGKSMTYKTPGGAPVVVAHRGSGNGVEDFIALSSTCPHLGCQVHFEAQKNRFFCPCHNGTFDPEGRPTGGPPQKAGQSLLRFPLRVEKGILMIQLPDELTAAKDAATEHHGAPDGPGQDPCLFESPNGGWA